MAILEDTFTVALAAVRSAAMTLPSSVAAVQPLSDGRLLSLQTQLADARRLLDAASSLVAGEIGFRSRPELGYDGLAQRSGFRTAERLVQHTTQSTARDAAGLVSVGTLVHEAVAPEPALPWLVSVGAAVAAGSLSVAAAQAIRDGVGTPSEAVSSDQLTDVVRLLVVEAPVLDVDALLRRARQLRDVLDAAGVADRERQIHLERSFRRLTRPNGLPRYIIDPDLESAAYWDELYSSLTSPRRGGPRFVSQEDRAWAEAVAADERTVEQYVHDAVTELVRIGVGADHSVVGARQPAVRVMVTHTALVGREGRGFVEGALRCPSRLRPSSALPALPEPCRWSSTTTAKRSTWAANSGCSRPGSASFSPRATVAAAGADATGRPAGAKRTTSSTGIEIGERPTSPTASCSADTITCCCTTTSGVSSAMVTGTG